MVLLIATAVGAVEATMLIFCGLRLIDAVFDPQLVMLAGIVHALLIRGVRLILYNVLLAPSGAHILATLFLLYLVVRFIVGVDAIRSALGVCLGFLILSMGAGAVMICLPRVDTSKESVQVLLMFVEQLPLVAATIIIARWKLRLVSGRAQAPGHAGRA
ncbi:MAG: hypothetical protein AB1445_12150 [Bacillota bacterium]